MMAVYFLILGSTDHDVPVLCSYYVQIATFELNIGMRRSIGLCVDLFKESSYSLLITFYSRILDQEIYLSLSF